MAKVITDKKLQERIGWYPHKCQQKILKSKSRDIVISAGRGFGKSLLCAYLCLKVLLVNDRKILIIAPTYDLTQRVFDNIVKWILKAFPSLQSGVSSRPFPKMMTPWGSTLECRSAENPVGILGERYHLVIVDEAAKISKDVFQKYIFPTTQMKGGKTLFISTPQGRNWFYERWLQVKPDGNFQFTSKDNPYFPRVDWDRAKKLIPTDLFHQEYEGSFVEGASTVFRYEDISKILNDKCLKDAIGNHYYVLGVDLAKHEDFTVIDVIDQYTNALVYHERINKMHYPYQKKRIISIARRYNKARVIIDSTGLGEPIYDDLLDEGLLVDDFKFTNSSKRKLIDKLRIYISEGKITIPPEEHLVEELKSFAYEVSDSGNYKYAAPQGIHDDEVFALALAVWGLTGGIRKEEPIKEELKKISRKRQKTNVYL